MKLKTQKIIAKSILGSVFISIYVFICWYIPILDNKNWRLVVLKYHAVLFGILFAVFILVWCDVTLKRKD